MSVINQNPTANAALIQDLQAMPPGRLSDLNGLNLDRDTLSHLSAQLANIMAQSHKRSRIFPTMGIALS